MITNVIKKLNLKLTLILLKPYRLFIFAIIYQVIWRQSITELMVSNTDEEEISELQDGTIQYPRIITIIAELLISEPLEEITEPDNGTINYPRIVTATAELLIAKPSEDESSGSDSEYERDEGFGSDVEKGEQWEEFDPVIHFSYIDFYKGYGYHLAYLSDANEKTTIMHSIDYVRSHMPPGLLNTVEGENQPLNDFIKRLRTEVKPASFEEIQYLDQLHAAIISYNMTNYLDISHNAAVMVPLCKGYLDRIAAGELQDVSSLHL